MLLGFIIGIVRRYSRAYQEVAELSHRQSPAVGRVLQFLPRLDLVHRKFEYQFVEVG